MASKNKLPLDSFVQSVRPNPSKKGEPLKIICGFLGKSSEKGSTRVYFDEALNEFVDFKDSDIVHAKKLTSEESALGGCKLWIKSSATYAYGDPEKKENRPKANFLQGNLAREFQARPDLGNLEAAALPFTVGRCRTVVCPITLNQTGCIRTRFDRTCIISCNRTCIGFSCFNNTCRVSCFRTCVTCFRTCDIGGCDINTIQRRTCICPISLQICNTPQVTLSCPVDPVEGFGPIQGTGFEDFNPIAGM